MANHHKQMEVLVTEGRFGDIAPQLDNEELMVKSIAREAALPHQPQYWTGEQANAHYSVIIIYRHTTVSNDNVPAPRSPPMQMSCPMTGPSSFTCWATSTTTTCATAQTVLNGNKIMYMCAELGFS